MLATLPQNRDRLPYWRKSLMASPLPPIGYWPQWDFGTTKAIDLSSIAGGGTYSNVTLGQRGIGDGRSSALYVPASNSYCDVYSAAMAALWNGAEGSVDIWGCVSGAGVWTDATTRRLFNFSVDANNRVFGGRSTVDNTLTFSFVGGGGTRTRTITTSTLAFWHVVCTWSVLANAFSVYFNGALQGAAQTLISGAMVGSLSSTQCVLGATATTPTAIWSGSIAHARLWPLALPPGAIAELYATGLSGL